MKTLVKLSALFCLLVFLGACRKSVMISGKITDFRTGKPVQGVEMALISHCPTNINDDYEDATTRVAALTDSLGHYELNMEDIHQWGSLHCQKYPNGYAPFDIQSSYKGGCYENEDFPLFPLDGQVRVIAVDTSQKRNFIGFDIRPTEPVLCYRSIRFDPVLKPGESKTTDLRWSDLAGHKSIAAVKKKIRVRTASDIG